MKYTAPINGRENESYTDANPSAGIEGSIVSAAAIEPVMREVVNVIEGAGLTPEEGDLTQLMQAMDIVAQKAATTSKAGAVYLAEKIDDARADAVPSAAMVKAAVIASSAAPIGMVYFQLAGMAEPKQLFGGEWKNISASFAGLFFRVEGGNATAFGGKQGDAIRNITGGIYPRMRNGAFIGSTDQYGALAPVANQSSEWQGGGGVASFPAGVSFDASRVVPTANENRPVNSTIRIWQRVA